MTFTGKTIWITGASSGIGRAVALEIAKSKAHLILSARNINSLEQVAAEVEKLGSTAEIVPFDNGNIDEVNRAAQTVLDRKVQIHALYMFAGISQRALTAETPLMVDRKIFEVNYFGTIALIKALLPSMIDCNDGCIAVTSSISGKFGFPQRSAYAASKHALHGFIESLQAENAKYNIRTSVIIPGRISTNISKYALDKEGKEHGKLDPGQANGMPADKAARIICCRLKKEKHEILVGGMELMMVHIRRFLPRLYFYLATKINPL